jgi:hypothetical protein
MNGLIPQSSGLPYLNLLITPTHREDSSASFMKALAIDFSSGVRSLDRSLSNFFIRYSIQNCESLMCSPL